MITEITVSRTVQLNNEWKKIELTASVEESYQSVEEVHNDLMEQIAELLGLKEAPQEEEDWTAKTLAELVTAKQLSKIRAMCREMKLDADEKCQTLLGCTIDELSKAGASKFIQYLDSK